MTKDYPSDWDSRRKNVYRRDDYTCQNCGEKGGRGSSTELHAHHIVPKSKGGSHSESNLVTLCEECHSSIHSSGKAPTAGGVGSKLSNRDVAEGLITILEVIAEKEATASDSVDKITSMIDPGSGIEFEPNAYLDCRENVIEDIVTIKVVEKVYEELIRQEIKIEYANHMGSIIDSTWRSIETKMSIIDESDELIRGIISRDVECSNCGHSVDHGSKFCNQCGKEIQSSLMCNNCGNELEEDANFCSECGSEAPDPSEVDKVEPVDTDEVDFRYENIDSDIEKASYHMNHTLILISRLIEISIEDKEVVFDCCPNCGMEKGVLSSGATAECVVCDAAWKKKGILNTKWELSNGSNIDKNTDHFEIDDWNRIGREKYENQDYTEDVKNINMSDLWVVDH